VDDALERDLVTRLRGGDARAFDEIYERLRARVFSFLARMTGRRDVADDLAQEVWLRLARTAPRLDPDTRLTAWIFTVARNLYISHWRAAQVATALGGDLLPEPEAPAAGPFEAAAEAQTQRQVERAVAALPPAYREILLLCAVEGLAPRDAAAVLEITPEAARQRLARARTMVAGALAGADGAAASYRRGGAP
jgi:RNA polymerase sigma-70 factor (ECF subfamily)